ncbi:uncharacterized protein LOC6737236 [Drosophila simulans]|uniref:DUF4485 domain-containing protein n=1 Tax=Drosophila simulans TaxID=7240 RepID=A0A0J9UGX2_DROSI|nr:uncharacterized protein LOC6737236 [Drosophila simulans]KMY98320.1 uncharacterized protein Dsimw501_GD14063 [Drosophila simulans]
MKDLSEELLDRHFKQQLASYKDADQARAKQSDRLIMASWIKVFEKAPLSEKLARNSLMLLMHGHLKDFGVLKEPFTDVRNCSRNLNAILDEYRGQPCRKLATGRSPTHLLKKCSTQILRPRKLEPIKEVSEHSEKEPRTSSFASIVTIIRKTNTRSSDSKDSLVSAKTGFESPNGADSNNVKERVELLEYELSRNKQHPSSSTFNRDQPDSGRTRSSTSLSQEIIDQVNRRSSAVKNLRDCFEEMTERLKNAIDPKYAVPTKYNPKIPPPKPPKKIHQDVPAQRVRQPIGQCHSPPIGCRDTTVQGLLIRREQLRVQCLAYYNSDGTMKDVMDMPDPSMDTRKDEQRVRGFIIGAYRALERLKRWRGKSKRLRFFQTCFQKFGLRNLWELQALDRRFERVALKWYRHKVMACQQNTWLMYRRSILAQKPSYDKDDLQQMRHQIELQEQLQRERMVHLAKIRELCRINCHGIITQEVLGKMLERLDDEQAQLDEDLKSLLRQKAQLFQ